MGLGSPCMVMKNVLKLEVTAAQHVNVLNVTEWDTLSGYFNANVKVTSIKRIKLGKNKQLFDQWFLPLH